MSYMEHVHRRHQEKGFLYAWMIIRLYRREEKISFSGKQIKDALLSKKKIGAGISDATGYELSAVCSPCAAASAASRPASAASIASAAAATKPCSQKRTETTCFV
ncbi:hypothetical protein Cni_G17772 [Canna indica]|uniref:Uncharacterized protein n=1 Tax=Canna indica TaxID=4628 RepID=A0AAQ3KI95_9LILI|nr:hypothetical protein Cni_G17772 [Canna indica]